MARKRRKNQISTITTGLDCTLGSYWSSLNVTCRKRLRNHLVHNDNSNEQQLINKEESPAKRILKYDIHNVVPNNSHDASQLEKTKEKPKIQNGEIIDESTVAVHNSQDNKSVPKSEHFTTLIPNIQALD